MGNGKIFFSTFLIILLTLLSGYLIGGLSVIPNDIGEFGNGFIILALISSLIYSFIFTTIDAFLGSNFKWAVVGNLCLGIVLVVYSYLFYNTKIDWLSVNNGINTLTEYEMIVKSDFTPWVIFIIFFLIYVLTGLFLKKTVLKKQLHEIKS